MEERRIADMGVRILESPDDGACFYCSTTGVAFGPVFGSLAEAERFLQVVPEDPRHFSDKELMDRYADFVSAHVCECGEVSGEDDADAKATAACFDHCTCDDFPNLECKWCAYKESVLNWTPKPGSRFVCWHCQKAAWNAEAANLQRFSHS